MAKVVKSNRDFEGLVGHRDKGHGGDGTLKEAEARLHWARFNGEGEPDLVVASVHVAQALFGINGDDHLVGSWLGGPPPQTVAPTFSCFNRGNEGLTWVDIRNGARGIQHEPDVLCCCVAVVEEFKTDFENAAGNGTRRDKALIVHVRQSGKCKFGRSRKVVHLVSAAEGFTDRT